MNRFTNRLGWAVTALALSIGGGALAGCGVEPGAARGTSSDLLMTHALATIDDSTWSEADAGCEGQLEEGVIFAVASADEGLVAAVDEDGEVICVDTVEAVEEELEETGRHDEADHLVHAFAATVAQAADRDPTGSRFLSPTREGDPQPEPNIEYSGFYMGDPQPEPNMN